MRKVIAGLAITLDGVVQAPAGNWLLFNDEMAEVIDAGTAQSDTILLGRETYLDFAERWPNLGNDVPMADFMNHTPKYVASGTLTAPLAWDNSTLVSGDLANAVTDLKRRPGKDIQIPGSPRLVRSLLRHGLVDELGLMIHPTVLGAGMRLFDDPAGQASLELELVESRTLSTGVLAVTYRL
jgi:dihydrofolate reductase